MSIQQMCSGDAALVPAGLRGYRMWNVSGSALTATNYEHGGWQDGSLTAECKRSTRFTFWVDDVEQSEPPVHEAPHPGCGCGIYGWYRPDEVRLHRGEIFGVVEASGRILLGDFGFRAQHARILALVVPGDELDARRTRATWTARGVAVFTDRDALLAEYPPDDVAELLGHEIPDSPPTTDWAAQLSQISLTIQMDVSAFQRAMVEIGRVYGRTAAQMDAMFLGYSRAPVTRIGTVEDDTRRDLTPRERALELRRTRNTGPAPRARGRARLDQP